MPTEDLPSVERDCALSENSASWAQVGFRILTNASAFAPGFYVDDVNIDL